MNRLRSNSIQIKEDKSKDKSLKGFYTDITVINNQNADNAGVGTGSRTTFLDLSCSNSGSKSTGKEVIGLKISQDNLLSVNDNIYINYTETAESLFNKAKKDSGISYEDCHRYGMLDLFKNDDGKKRFNKSLSGGISIPLGYWTFDTSMSYSKERSIIDKVNKRKAEKELFI
ncbi:hypothetical protein AGMMS49592_0130 [Endomicrobiia bacterium]|nr:hypothetical protein AGMMS49592_0130 [Endomicrobiia bacterium]